MRRWWRGSCRCGTCAGDPGDAGDGGLSPDEAEVLVSHFGKKKATPHGLPGLFATMGARTPGRPALWLCELEHRLGYRPVLPASCHRTVRSFRLQPPTVVPTLLWVFCAGRTGPHWCGHPLGVMRQLGFASTWQARHDGRPNRVHLCYGLIVLLRLLSTPPHCDAVTVGYGVPEHSGRDFYSADSVHTQAH